MATWTEEELATKILSYLGAKAQGQDPTADDLDLVTAAIDSVVDGVRLTGAITFGLDAIPEWAQWPLIKMVAFEVGPMFGRPQSPDIYRMARMDLIANANGAPALDPAAARYY